MKGIHPTRRTRFYGSAGAPRLIHDLDPLDFCGAVEGFRAGHRCVALGIVQEQLLLHLCRRGGLVVVQGARRTVHGAILRLVMLGARSSRNLDVDCARLVCADRGWHAVLAFDWKWKHISGSGDDSELLRLLVPLMMLLIWSTGCRTSVVDLWWRRSEWTACRNHHFVSRVILDRFLCANDPHFEICHQWGSVHPQSFNVLPLIVSVD